MSREFRVIWEIDVEAETPLEAARLAQAMQKDPNSGANYFVVRHAEELDVHIDLSEQGEME